MVKGIEGWATRQRLQRLFVVSLCVLAGAGCTESSSPESGADLPDWEVSIPEVVPRSLEEVLPEFEPDPEIDPPSQAAAAEIVDSDPDEGPDRLDVGEVSAAVFERGSDELNREHAEWLALEEVICGPEGLVEDAIAAGWYVVVTGFVDSSGAHGPGTLNDTLQETRAVAAREALIEVCAVPSDRVVTAKGGIAGDDAAARKVTVVYARSSGDGEGEDP